MRIFRKFSLKGEPDRLVAVMDEIGRSLPEGWSRDGEAEAKLTAIDPSSRRVYCFVSTGDGYLPAATLYLVGKRVGVISAANLVPLRQDRLGVHEYNEILRIFSERIAGPCARKLGVEIELTGDRADLEYWLSPEAAAKLRAFSAMANRGTGASHPLDQERWIDFLVTAHRDESRLEASDLKNWLVEIEGWPVEIADQLAGEYEFSGELLSFSAGQRVGG